MSEFLQVAEKVLRECREPMRPQDIVDYALRNRMFSDNIAGKTPHQTMKAKLSVDIRRKADQSKFIRTAPGRFHLRNLLNQDAIPYTALPLAPPKESHQVLVFPSSVLDDLGRFQGIKKNWKRIAGTTRGLINTHVRSRSFPAPRGAAVISPGRQSRESSAPTIQSPARGGRNPLGKDLPPLAGLNIYETASRATGVGAFTTNLPEPQ